jgi:hypothetical protein
VALQDAMNDPKVHTLFSPSETEENCEETNHHGEYRG